MLVTLLPNCIHTADLILGVLDCVLAKELQLCQLKELIGVGNGIERGAQIFECLLVADGHKRRERIALASAVCLRLQECLEQLRGVRDEGLGVLEN